MSSIGQVGEGRAGAFALVRLDAAGSTNDEARKRITDGWNEPFVVWADQQNAGRGRRGRTWASLPGNLFASFAVWPRRGVADWPQASFAAALATADTLAGALAGTAVSVQLKWPNDVLLDGGKVAGILLERAPGPGSSPGGGSGEGALVIGIGINVVAAPDDQAQVAGQGSAQATALSHFVTPPALDYLLDGLATRLGRWLETWQAAGFEAVRRAWLERSGVLGAAIRVKLPGETLDGVFADMDRDGALVLDQHGTRRRIAAGDVALLAGLGREAGT